MPMKYKSKASSIKPPMLGQENAFLGDVFTSLDKDKPISAGLYRLEKGKPLVYPYTYDEMKIVIEGSYQITDETGYTVTGVPGDVFYFEKGCTITFTTEDYGLAFYCGQRPADTA